jgi:NADH-quinone oxidoreductase chain G
VISLTIDDREVEVEEGSTILEAAQKAGIEIPTFCYHKNLLPFGACRVCVVEVEQMKGRLVPSCSTPATNGMMIHTNTPEIRKARKTLLELLLIHHPLDCPVCDKAGDCKLQELVYEYELTENRFQDTKFTNPVDHKSPLVERNTNRCVLCGMCARVCDEVVGVSAISFVNRGFDTVIGTNFDRVLNCEFCGECINICPVGALNDKLFKYKARSWDLTDVNTICSYCGTGCTLTLGVKDDKIMRVVGDDTIGVNKGRLCSKGRFGYQYVVSPERINSPFIKRQDGGLARATWQEALERIVQGFTEIKEKAGPAAIGGICSDRLTNEEVYSFQKFMRTAIGTNNIDHAGGYSYSGLLKGLKSSLGQAANTLSLDDIRNADTILVIRSNVSETHPVVGYQINMAVKRDSAKLILASERTIKLNRLATVSLAHKPGTEIALVNGLIKTLVSENLYDQSAVSSIEGFEAFKSATDRLSENGGEQVTGVNRETMKEAARLLASGKKVCVLTSSGLGTLSDDEEFAHALSNLALLAGLIGRDGSGIAFLGEKSNSQGALDMGAHPDLLPGVQDVSNATARSNYEEAWKASIPAKHGQGALEMLANAEKGTLKGLYLAGENPLVTYPDTAQTQKALESLEFLVVQDQFLTPTAKLADVVLPVASFAEKSGTYTNFERRVQKLTPGIEQLEGVKTDLTIFNELSRLLGYELNADSPDQMMQEIRQLVSLYEPADYNALGTEGLVLKAEGAKGRFLPVEGDGRIPAKSESYPLVLLTGSVLFHSGSLSTHSPELNQISPGGWAEIAPEDARNFQLDDGQPVVIASPRGTIESTVKINRKQAPGMVFIPYHFETQPVNRLTGKDLSLTYVTLKKA